MNLRNTMFDGPHIGVVTDPSWLLAPLYARDATGLHPAGELPGALVPAAAAAVLPADLITVAEADWTGWWTAACEFRPGPPAPRTLDLVHFSAELTTLWTPTERAFDRWRRTRPAPAGAAHDESRPVELRALEAFESRTGRTPIPRTLRILQLPVVGHFLASPDVGILIVSEGLRHDLEAWADALESLLPQHF